MTNTTDWRTLSGLELDEFIARRVGWWKVDGEGWKVDREGWYGPDYDANINPAPPFCTDVNFALTLAKNGNFKLWTSLFWNASFDPMCDPYDPTEGTYESDDIPAQAICKAWLAWKDRQRD